MRHVSSGLSGGEAHHAGIAKKIEQADFTTGRPDLILRKGPVHAVFLEQAQVAKRRAPGIDLQPAPLHRPGVGRGAIDQLPIATIIIASLRIKAGIGGPSLNRSRGRPEGLRVWTNDGLAAEPLQLVAIAAIEQGILVLVPLVGEEECRFGLPSENPLWRQPS